MGQSQSHAAAAAEPSPSPDRPLPPSAEDSPMAETSAKIENEESRDKKIQIFLENPCMAPLTSGPCGTQVTNAFRCFSKSVTEEKVPDCVKPFTDLLNCIEADPKAIVDHSREESNDKQDKETTPDYNLAAPSWSRERKRKI